MQDKSHGPGRTSGACNADIKGARGMLAILNGNSIGTPTVMQLGHLLPRFGSSKDIFARRIAWESRESVSDVDSGWSEKRRGNIERNEGM